jgi:hypothetical protein
MLEPELLDFLENNGLHIPAHHFVMNIDEAKDAARQLNSPFVLKIVSPDILHKSDVGGVRLGLKNPNEVEQAFIEMMVEIKSKCPKARLDGALLIEQVPQGLEVIVGITQDTTFGPVIMFGLGGVFVEAMRDVVFRAVPVEKKDALQMILGIKNKHVLSGWRGGLPVDIEKLADLICRVSDLSDQHHEIKELDLNPIRICEDDILILDARILIE